MREITQEMAVTSYWFMYYATDHCTLCGNTGIIDTRSTRTPAGVLAGRLNLCICPNGQAMRAAGVTAEPTDLRSVAVRPYDAPKINGCQPDCGHSEEEHLAFDRGAYDGERRITIPPVEYSQDSDHSRTLRAAWMMGYSAGLNNAPDAPPPPDRETMA
jgi:hypothetical protein